jgi:hypothetical protein
MPYLLGEDPVVVFDSYPRLQEQVDRERFLADEAAPFSAALIWLVEVP